MALAYSASTDAVGLLEPLTVTLRSDALRSSRRCPELWTEVPSMSSPEVVASATPPPASTPPASAAGGTAGGAGGASPAHGGRAGVPQRVGWHAVPAVASSTAATEYRVVLIPVAIGAWARAHTLALPRAAVFDQAARRRPPLPFC